LPACTATNAARIATSAEVGDHLADGLGLVGRLLEREGVGEGLILEFARREAQAATRLALRVEVEELRGDVADLLRGASARARPLVGSELVQRRGFRCAARIARDAVQGMHRHVEPVAALVFEHEELARLPADLHRLQADIAADAVLLVHHRRAGREGLQVAEDRVGVGCRGFAAPPLLPGARAEELRFREHRDGRQRGVAATGARQTEALEFRGDREAHAVGAREEALPALAGGGMQLRAAQQLGEHLAAARRVRSEQHAAREAAEEGL
jgi:hypothetical protein